MALRLKASKQLLVLFFRGQNISQRTASSFKEKNYLREDILRYLDTHYYYLTAVEAIGVPVKSTEKVYDVGLGESFASKYTGWRFEWSLTDDCQRPYRAVSSRVVFGKGYEALEKYATGQELEQSYVPAFETLEHFYNSKDNHEVSLRLLKTASSESTIASLLTQHLLYQLISHQSNHILNKFLKDQPDRCPSEFGKSTHFGSTEFGSSLLFFGQADIVLFPTVKDLLYEEDDSKTAFFTIDKNPDDTCCYEMIEDSWISVDELNKDDISMQGYNKESLEQHDYHKIFKQAIAASICKRKNILDNDMNNNRNDSVRPVVPVCGVTKNSYSVTLYDAENDYLLRMHDNSLPIFKGDDLQFSAVLDLWLLINHNLFCTQPSPKGIEMLRGTCNLIPQLGQKNYEVILKNSKYFFQREQTWTSLLTPPKIFETMAIV